MFNWNTDKEWERLGRSDPYFGVVTRESYHLENLDERNREEFFRTGEVYVEQVMDNIRRHIEEGFRPKRTLDFGCGVGRLVIPFARFSDEVTGVDVSEAMVREARANCMAAGLKNTVLFRSDDGLGVLDGKYDLVNSFVVFQHIPVARGCGIFGRLLSFLEPGGVGVCHFTYSKNTRIKYIVYYLTRYVPYLRNMINFVKNRGFTTPQMQMNIYNMNTILDMIRSVGATSCYLDFTDHDGHLGVNMYFRKPE